jgi:UDP:flavonoid glycosyltransferase YjiC (YdhE family)
MKVLFAPCTDALQPQLILPHLIPLVALASRLDPREYQTTFLAPKCFHHSLRSLGHHVQDIDYDVHHPFRGELMAYEQFRPDLVVDDMSTTALLSTSLAGIPRIAIRRTGIFPGVAPRNSAHRHSLMYPSLTDRFENCEEICGVPQPKTFADIFASAASIVPGTRSVEILNSVSNASLHYWFSGPLILPDKSVYELSGGNHLETTKALSSFVDVNSRRKIVFLTSGTMLNGWNLLLDVVCHIIQSGGAVVSNIDVHGIEPSLRERYFFSPFLPLHEVCSSAHFMIHHCGSGTYQYQLLHLLPSICIGSGCYDRDDVAARLEELGVAKYVPSPEENPDFLSQFRMHYDECADVAGAWYANAKHQLAQLKAESERTSAAFDFGAVLHAAVR